MDEPPPKPEKPYPLSTSNMSKTPSWIMLGFLLGAAFVLALPPLRKKPAVEPAAFKKTEPAPSQEPREPPELTTIEAVFAEWGKHAVWVDGTTEVALWNSRDKDYTNFYEVRRIDGEFYFRTIPRLTRRIITRGKPMPESPLQFTETEEQYQEWAQHGRAERPREGNLQPTRTPSSTPAAPRFDESQPKFAPPTIERIAPPLEVPAPNGAPKK